MIRFLCKVEASFYSFSVYKQSEAEIANMVQKKSAEQSKLLCELS